MRYPPEVKEKACKMYRGGTHPSRIAERLGIPLSTIYGWTRDLQSRRLSVFDCPVCRELTVRRHLRRKYCSEKCKSKAKYRRSQKTKQVFRRCIECRKSFPVRTNKLYCSKQCKNRAAKRRERQLNPCIETLEKAIEDAPDKKIKNDDYETEITTINHFLTKGLLTQRQRERVQNIQKRVVV